MNRIERALAIVDALEGAPSIARALDLFQQALEPFGVTVFRAGPMPNPLQRRDLAALAETNWSQEWTEFYFGRRAFTFDPTLRAARRRERGFFWRDVPLVEGGPGQGLMRDAACIGMVDGFVALRQLPGELKTAVFLAGEGFDWSPLEQGVVSFVANAMISRVLELRDAALTPKVRRLTDREADVLHYAALGRSDKEIAEILGIGFSTVRFHWRSIRHKLGAVDRANAVAVGLWSGQIKP